MVMSRKRTAGGFLVLSFLASSALMFGTGDAQATTGMAARGSAVTSSDPRERIDKSVAGKGTPEAPAAERREAARAPRSEH